MLQDIHEGQQLIDIYAHLALIEYDLGNFHKAKTICEETLVKQLDLDTCWWNTSIISC